MATTLLGSVLGSLLWIDTWFDWLLLFLLASLFLTSYVITEELFKPPWYSGHQNDVKLCENPPDLDDCWRIDNVRTGLGTPKTELSLDFEDVVFECGPFRLSGNKFLRGWFIPAPDHSNELCVVICHGGGRDRRQHLRHVPTLQQSGAAVLLFDKQEHGLSDGCHRGIGWFSYEGSDVYAACKYAKITRNFKRVVAMGTSFGAVGVLTASGYFDKSGDEQIIDGVIAENPPHSRRRFVRELLYKYGEKFGIPLVASDLLSFFSCFTIIVRRGAPFTPDPIDVMKNISPRPLLIMHGRADSIVPFEHGFDLYQAALQPKECLWVPKCDHTLVYNVDPIGWSIKTTALLRQVMSIEGGKPMLQ